MTGPAHAASARAGTLSGDGDKADAWDAEAARAIPLIEAMKIARAATAEVTGLPVDGIAASGADAHGGWCITVEVIESPARMGENDLLSAHEVRLAPDGGLAGFTRVGRYRREDAVGRAS